MFPAPRLGSESIGTKPCLVDFGGKNEEESVGSNEVHLNTCRGKRAAGGRQQRFGNIGRGLQNGIRSWNGWNWGLCQMAIQGIMDEKEL